jgi:hypothetical protein
MEVIKIILENPQSAGIVIALVWIGYMTRQVNRLQNRLDFVQDRQLENRQALRSVGMLSKTDIGETE